MANQNKQYEPYQWRGTKSQQWRESALAAAGPRGIYKQYKQDFPGSETLQASPLKEGE
jgi:hypothetical protein